MAPQSTLSALSAGDEAASSRSHSATARRPSSSQDSVQSEGSHTALDIIREQMQLEADAREALPYSIEHCTKPLGRLRQSVFACLTCNPPPADPAAPYPNSAGVCYACSVQCHGDHTLVELFTKRQFTCDCGTTRFPIASPCKLRINAATNTRGDVHSEAPDPGNFYNHNFRNRFCGCACDYDPFQQRGTMFQCLGLGTPATGGCGEDWYHPGCVVGLGPQWDEGQAKKAVRRDNEKPENGEAKGSANGSTEETSMTSATNGSGALPTIAEDGNDEAAVDADGDGDSDDDDDEQPLPPGFPKEDDFEGFICYKCVEAYPWIKQYAGTPGFLPAVFCREEGAVENGPATSVAVGASETATRKRKAEDDDSDVVVDASNAKRQRADDDDGDTTSSNHAPEELNEKAVQPANGNPADDTSAAATACKRKALPPAPTGRFSLFFVSASSFRDAFCRCAACFPLLAAHPQLLEEEETYEPPVSEDGGSQNGGSHGGADNHSAHHSEHSGSLYDRGESALRNIDRVRAIEGVMAYNHLKDKLKPFFQQFAASGQAISAEDIKAYFAQLRGDEEAIRAAGAAAQAGGGDEGGGGNNRREQSGY
ncbi:metaphase-anaphase transition protein [Niveomyces insectorum RCEF 264]|uniref:Metaphase-anaphase transition protein n=1 Tax=Niveomyces insectorum RCEF 264 TaxID=1081102 RepID=A0A167UT09_9HYPO|nr:metaphase-anaphase transition protein [Niveomyces insectorum RCEF 264]